MGLNHKQAKGVMRVSVTQLDCRPSLDLTLFTDYPCHPNHMICANLTVYFLSFFFRQDNRTYTYVKMLRRSSLVITGIASSP
jgi:hypothetical protein